MGMHYPGNADHLPNPSRPRAAPAMACGLALALLAGCGGGERVRAEIPPSRAWHDNAPADPAAANAVLMRAISLVGTPYRYGGNTPDGGFDCSGLVNYVYRDMLDLRLPRTSRALADYQGPRIAPGRLASGDLVFFGRRGRVDHVGIYLGDGRFVHAPRTGRDVTVSSLEGGYWGGKFLQARRVAGI